MKLTLKDKKTEAGNAVSFILEAEQPLQWEAGQFLTYTLPHPNPDERGVEHWFTISSAPAEGHVMLTTRIFGDKASTFKQHLSALEPGDSIEVSAPEGDFTADGSKEYIFIAGGIGITPFRSILTQLDHDKQPINATSVYTNKDEDYIFKDELEAIAARSAGMSIEYFTGDKKLEESDIKRLWEQHPSAIFYVSGPEPMVEHFVEVFKNIGIPEHQAKADYFPNYDFTG